MLAAHGNDYRLRVDAAAVVEVFAELKIRIPFAEGVPNLEPPDDIKITYPGPIVHAIQDTRGEAEPMQRR